MADVVESLNVLAKEVFGDEGVPDLCPNGVFLQKDVPFDTADAMGLKFAQAVRLSYPNGFTNAKGDGSAGAFTFNNAKPGAQGRAELLGYQTLLRDQMSYEDAAKLQKDGRQSFEKGLPFFTEGLQKSMRKRLEAMLLHGGQSVGQIASTSGATTTRVLTLTAAQWAPFIWAGNEGMEIDAYSALSAGVQRNLNAPIVLVTSDPVARTISISGNAADLTATLASDYLYFRGNYGVEVAGVHSILANTGLLFNIDASVYSMWKGTQYAPTAGALTFQKLKKAIAIAVSRGLDEDLELYVHPSTWDDLNSDILALRKIDDKDTKKVEIGSEEIVYKSQNGSTKLRASGFAKEGFSFGLCNPATYWKRVGAADVTFNMPGMGDQMFFHLPNNAGVEFRAYTHQAILSLAPAKQILISNIINTSY